MPHFSTENNWSAQSHLMTPQQKSWLTDRNSLTQKLNRLGTLKVIPIQTHQIRLPYFKNQSRVDHRNQYWFKRDVLLLVNDIPMIYASSITPQHHVREHWPFFLGLGSRPLGHALFSDPLIHRHQFEFKRITTSGIQQLEKSLLRFELFERIHSLPLPTLPFSGSATLWARRANFAHRQHPGSQLIVSETFLPAVFKLNNTYE